jgi:hypothetical protein
MKINYIDDTEDLTEFSYIYKRDVFRRNNLYYRFVKNCYVCGESFFMRLSYPTDVCSVQCSMSKEDKRVKISRSLTGHKRSLRERSIISNRMNKGDVVKNNTPLFDTYYKQLIPVEEVDRFGIVLLVRCSLCNEWFIPKRTAVEARAQFIKGNTDREGRFYCSDGCKFNCPIFNKRKYPSNNKNNSLPSENQIRIWSKEVLKRHNHICEYCGKKANTAHHIIPKKLDQFYALDPDNGIACCEECHYKYGHKDECNTYNLSKITC